MSSNSLNESTSNTVSPETDLKDDIGLIIKHHNSLRKKHNALAKDTAKGLGLTATLAERQDNKIKKQDKKIFVLTLAVIVQAVYLLIFL